MLGKLGGRGEFDTILGLPGLQLLLVGKCFLGWLDFWISRLSSLMKVPLKLVVKPFESFPKGCWVASRVEKAHQERPVVRVVREETPGLANTKMFVAEGRLASASQVQLSLGPVNSVR